MAIYLLLSVMMAVLAIHNLKTLSNDDWTVKDINYIFLFFGVLIFFPACFIIWEMCIRDRDIPVTPAIY